MNCGDFRGRLAAIDNSREAARKETLTSEMSAHLEECRDCTEYFSEMSYVQDLLIAMERKKMSADLSLKLKDLPIENQRAALHLFSRTTFFRPLGITILAIVIWVIAAVFAPGILPLVEVAILLIGLVPMFQRLGSSLLFNSF